MVVQHALSSLTVILSDSGDLSPVLIVLACDDLEE